MKVLIVLALAVAVGVAVMAKSNSKAKDAVEDAAQLVAEQTMGQESETQLMASAVEGLNVRPRPKLVDLGAGKCIPCKMMAPILEELTLEYKGIFDVVFIDVWEDKAAGEPYAIRVIPTQIFFDAEGNELFRHEGFFSKKDILGKWEELGVDLGAAPNAPETISRLEPVAPDTRATSSICYMCDEDIQPRTRVALQTPQGDVLLCSPHCYFITYSSLTDKAGTHERAQVTDWSTGQNIAAVTATYLIGQDEHRRPLVKAFAEIASAEEEMRREGGNLADWVTLETKELANRCGFCDRAVYPEDASLVHVGSLSTWGCCPMCALGVAARLQKDITVEQRDAQTGEMVQVTTMNGSVAQLKPKTAVAWAGQHKDESGKMVSAGCFKQAFFATQDNLKQWLEANPTATGKQITIAQALSEKMQLTPEQIAGACKIGECTPR